jgi:adenylylsulfate kinase-like enzyme
MTPTATRPRDALRKWPCSSGPQGITTIASLIAPRAFSRNLARQRHVERGQAFFEIYVATPLSVCQARDPKALYRGSQQGEVKLMTGVDSSYEAPLAPELVVSTEFDSTETLAQRVVALL